jgi:excinuclease ABC subunit C
MGWVVDKELERDQSELVEYLLQNVYGKDATFASDVPKEVLVPVLPEDADALSQWLSGIRGSKVDLRIPQRGDKRALAETALTNARHALGLYKLRRTADFTARSEALADLQEALKLETAPLRIECFDVSHLGGTGIVSSMVVFEDGLPKKSQYRKFNIESSSDDTESLYQTLTRRLKYLNDGIPDNDNKFSYRPGLLIVDGGQPQVNAAAKAMQDSGISDIAVIGLAKRLEEIWLPNNPFPVILPRGSEALFLLQRVRDEAHRFAITAQRAQRKSSIATELGSIEGLGDKRVSALLRRFGSAKRLKLATVEEIAEVAGIGPVLAASIAQRLADADK